MNASQFYGNAAFSGGGCMPQTTPVADSPFTPSKNRDIQALLPMTIKQINDAFQSCDDKTNLNFDSVDIGTISLVGRVCNKSEHATDAKFVLDDGTGTIRCTKWLQEPADSIKVDSILNGMYVRVYGHLKGFQGEKNLKVFSVFSFRPVTDFNEIAHHFIDCMYIVHLYNSKLQHIQASIPNQKHVPNFTQITPTKCFQPQAIPPYYYQFSGEHNNGPKSVEELVVDVLLLYENRINFAGTSVDVIAQHVGIPMDKLMLAFNNLIEEGVIYEAFTNHYKSVYD